MMESVSSLTQSISRRTLDWPSCVSESKSLEESYISILEMAKGPESSRNSLRPPNKEKAGPSEGPASEFSYRPC